MYRKSKEATSDWLGGDIFMTSLVSGAVAGTTATVATYPLDFIRTTFASQGVPKVGRLDFVLLRVFTHLLYFRFTKQI